jgi:FtsZ-interacting cell division protein ZipA
MTKFFRDNERGTVPGYVVGILTLAILLVGGVMLLKNVDNSETVANKPVESGEFKADDTKTEEKTEDEAAVPKEETKKEEPKTEATTTTTTTTTETVATTGSTEYTPEKLTATGPEDFVMIVVGLILISATIYTLWDYVKSRSAVKTALLRK